ASILPDVGRASGDLLRARDMDLERARLVPKKMAGLRRCEGTVWCPPHARSGRSDTVRDRIRVRLMGKEKAATGGAAPSIARDQVLIAVTTATAPRISAVALGVPPVGVAATRRARVATPAIIG